jgi:hypothetical protein
MFGENQGGKDEQVLEPLARTRRQQQVNKHTAVAAGQRPVRDGLVKKAAEAPSTRFDLLLSKAGSSQAIGKFGGRK